MTDHSITITNSVNTFGIAPSSKWNAYAWNAFKWGEGTTDLRTDVVHLISNSISGDTAFGFRFTKGISETLTVTADLSSERLRDGEGYLYVFREGTTDGETRVFPTWASGTTATASWTVASSTSTTWS